MSPPATSEWDVDEIVAQALEVLRYGPGDVDVCRVERAATVATGVIDNFVDSEDPLTPSPNMVARAVQVTIEEYQRPGVAWGVVGAWSQDQVMFRISGDPLAGVREGLYADKQRWGVA